uniref:Uncharacterized protein n=1 Tax=Lepeophtheirus salmonis TaxID=72036 RepID=A0A0K2T432_LEPSM
MRGGRLHAQVPKVWKVVSHEGLCVGNAMTWSSVLSENKVVSEMFSGPR